MFPCISLLYVGDRKYQRQNNTLGEVHGFEGEVPPEEQWDLGLVQLGFPRLPPLNE